MPEPEKELRIRHALDALCMTPDRLRLMRTSPTFRSVAESIIGVADLALDGLAAEAHAIDERVALALAAARGVTPHA